MAFNQSNQTTEGFERKLYIGVASSFVLGVNPTADEIMKLRGFNSASEPTYIKEVVNNEDGKTNIQARIDFIVKPNSARYLDNNNNPINFTAVATFFVTNRYFKSRNKGTYQIIDKYGRTAWASEDDIRNKRIPVYSNGNPADIDVDYRPAFIGEAALTDFIKNYLNISSPRFYKDGIWNMRPASELVNCEARLDNINNLFKGDFSEIKNAIKMGQRINGNEITGNEIKLLYGIRNTDDGAQYQNIYTRLVLNNSVKTYKKLEKDVQDSINAGGLQNQEYEFTELHEYVVNSTNFNKSTASMPVVDNPFMTPTQPQAQPQTQTQMPSQPQQNQDLSFDLPF